jgi:hypothetical protein
MLYSLRVVVVGIHCNSVVYPIYIRPVATLPRGQLTPAVRRPSAGPLPLVNLIYPQQLTIRYCRHTQRDQGKRSEARDLLAPVYNWFTEEFDTPVLQEAKALVEQLSA